MSHPQSDDLPWEIIVDIVSRLPVKSLLRFRCVSTSWRALIDSPDFVKLHLNQSIKTNTNRSLILRAHNRLYAVDFDVFCGGDINPVKLANYPFTNGDVRVCGTCNGLVCLSDSSINLALWNPSTRECRELPNPVWSTGDRDLRNGYGFGYDRVSDEYKVVAIFGYPNFSNFNLFNLNFEVEVFRLKSNSWYRAEHFPRDLHLESNHAVLAGNALHWVGSEKNNPSKILQIVAFHLNKEKFQVIPQPEYSNATYPLSMDSLDGCLCVVYHHFGASVDVWVMKDYGVKESWTKLISVIGPLACLGRYFHPIAYSVDYEEILVHLSNSVFFWFSLKEGLFKPFWFRGLSDLSSIETCVGSLVPINVRCKVTGTGSKRRKEKRKRIQLH